jgi:hypothetical protein
MVATKADVVAWIDAQVARGVRLRAQVEMRLRQLRLEQQPAALREVPGPSSVPGGAAPSRSGRGRSLVGGRVGRRS